MLLVQAINCHNAFGKVKEKEMVIISKISISLQIQKAIILSSQEMHSVKIEELGHLILQFSGGMRSLSATVLFLFTFYEAAKEDIQLS